MRRPIRQQRFKDVFRWTREAGIRICANYMMGLPGETRDDLEQTYQLAEELSEDAFDICYYVFYPYPGTALFQQCKTRGLLPDDYRERAANQRETILALVDLTQEDLGEYYDRFTQLRLRMCTRRQPDTDAAEQHELIEHVRDVARRG